jgi:hypothetical protein
MSLMSSNFGGFTNQRQRNGVIGFGLVSIGSAWAEHVTRMGKVRGAYNILVGRPEGRRPLGRPRRRWEDNIKIYQR